MNKHLIVAESILLLLIASGAAAQSRGIAPIESPSMLLAPVDAGPSATGWSLLVHSDGVPPTTYGIRYGYRATQRIAITAEIATAHQAAVEDNERSTDGGWYRSANLTGSWILADHPVGSASLSVGLQVDGKPWIDASRYGIPMAAHGELTAKLRQVRITPIGAVGFALRYDNRNANAAAVRPNVSGGAKRVGWFSQAGVRIAYRAFWVQASRGWTKQVDADVEGSLSASPDAMGTGLAIPSIKASSNGVLRVGITLDSP